MTKESKATRNQSRRMLACCRRAIDRFPLRQRVPLLHELEEAETRLSAIAKANVAAQLALAERKASMEFEGASVSPAVDFSHLLKSLKRCRDELGAQLNRMPGRSR